VLLIGEGKLVTKYEFFRRRRDHAVIEATYSRGLWSWLSDLLAAYWRYKVNHLTMDEAEKLLAVVPRRSKRYG